ncbi:MAG: amidohydrolase family protein [Chloroflexota bacterium]
MTAFDLVLRGGSVVDGTGSPARRADVGVLGDRILAVDDLSAVDPAEVALVLDVSDRVVAPGFVDPHGHSDGSVFVDGALASHLRQGYTTQLSGNCGDTLAPITDVNRSLVALSLRPNALVARWRTVGEYLDAVDRLELGPNVAFLAGHGTIRGAILGPDDRDPTDAELAAIVGEVGAALDAGAFGLSTGLIYAPGLHADARELEAVARRVADAGALYATHMRNEAARLFEAIDEAISTARAGGDGVRLQVSHLKCGARSVWGRAGEAVERLDRARTDGIDLGVDQYPYTAAATTLTAVLPPDLLALGVDETVAALSDVHGRARAKQEIDGGVSGWENLASDPGWDAIVISWAASHPDWAGRSIGAIAKDDGREPADVAFDALVDDRLDVSIVIHCMAPEDVAAIAAVPWIGVGTDAEGRRPGHPILDVGRPHPRTYGSTARLLGEFVRDRGLLTLEAAVTKLSAIPARRLGLRDRGLVREGAFADLVVFDPTTVADAATYDLPARHPTGIDHVVINGRAAVLAGRETGERPGRLLRRAS